MVYEPPPSSFRTNKFRYDPQGKEVLEALGLGIWMGEGSKGPRRVEVTNCDPKILRLWLQFLVEICGVAHEDIVLKINLHDPSRESEASRFWDQELGVCLRKQIPAKKVVVPNPKRKQLMGTCSLRFNSKFLQAHIEHRVDELAEVLWDSSQG